MFQKKVVEKIKTHFMVNIFFWKPMPFFLDNVATYGRTSRNTDDNVMRRMRFACLKTKARIQTHFQNM
jgi:hypothetical protein